MWELERNCLCHDTWRSTCDAEIFELQRKIRHSSRRNRKWIGIWQRRINVLQKIIAAAEREKILAD